MNLRRKLLKLRNNIQSVGVTYAVKEVIQSAIVHKENKNFLTDHLWRNSKNWGSDKIGAEIWRIVHILSLSCQPTVTIMKTASQVDLAHLLDCSAWKEKILVSTKKPMRKKINLFTDSKISCDSQPFGSYFGHSFDR